MPEPTALKNVQKITGHIGNVRPSWGHTVEGLNSLKGFKPLTGRRFSFGLWFESFGIGNPSTLQQGLTPIFVRPTLKRGICHIPNVLVS